MWSQSDDDRVRELCKTLDVGKLTKCPKCGMGEEGSNEMILAQFCTHKYCPFREWRLAKEPKVEREKQPRVTDNDSDEIAITFNGKELRGFSYANEDERRLKMRMARQYVEGWCDGKETK